VHALYPNGENQQTLSKLIEKDPGAKIKGPLDQLTAFYPGCNSINPVKRWPHFESLEKLIGYSKVIWIAGKQDLDYSSSYSHLKITTALFPQRFINNRTIWNVFKRLGLLKAWAHYSFKGKDNVFIQKFDWAELVYIFRRCRSFVGNDGGIMHLAAVSGAKGIAIFGPTSVEKNRPHNDKINCIKMDFPCQPCQFGAGGIYMAKGQINCPFGVKCLDQLKPEEIVERL
jgi:ADP-heptose:LPS heptosyltransferase